MAAVTGCAGRRKRQEFAALRAATNRCALCGGLMAPVDIKPPDRRARTIDHIRPRSKGGTHDMTNVRVVHFGCNQRRGNGA